MTWTAFAILAMVSGTPCMYIFWDISTSQLACNDLPTQRLTQPMEYDVCPSATTQQPATFGPHSPIQLLRHSIPIETADLQAWPFLAKNCASGCGSCCQCCLKGLSSLVGAHTRGDKDFATFAILQFRPYFIIMWTYFYNVVKYHSPPNQSTQY